MVEPVREGVGSFHAMFVVGDHVRGQADVLAQPIELGPSPLRPIGQTVGGGDRDRAGEDWIVEDELSIREIVRLHLSLAGFEAEEVADGHTALHRKLHRRVTRHTPRPCVNANNCFCPAGVRISDSHIVTAGPNPVSSVIHVWPPSSDTITPRSVPRYSRC